MGLGWDVPEQTLPGMVAFPWQVGNQMPCMGSRGIALAQLFLATKNHHQCHPLHRNQQHYGVRRLVVVLWTL